mmetsp:Transcript_23061/g.25266  ORF Transcript_23061/g.25266 Transcript_23061/m.25266 type:complete len:330 (-) Transcript_23061:28-1017(-)|eukprot:gene1447-1535_t
MGILGFVICVIFYLSLVNGRTFSSAIRRSQEVRHRQFVAFRGGETRKDILDDTKNGDKREKLIKVEKRSKANKRKRKQSENSKKVKTEDTKDEEEIEAAAISLNVPFHEILKRTWDRTPPITLAYLIASISLTTYAFCFNQNRWPSILHFNWTDVLLKWHFWKLITGFLFLGPFDLFYPLTLQFIWQNMSQLEKLFYKTPEEFFFLLLFGGTMLILFYTILGLPMTMLGHNLGSYLLYIWSKLFEGMDVNFMDIFVLKSELLPYFFCLQSILLEQQFPTGDLLGIVIGYLYYLLKQKNRIWIPEAVKSFFRSSPFLQSKYSKFKDDFEL